MKIIDLRPGSELRGVLVEATKWLCANDGLFSRYGWDLIDASIGAGFNRTDPAEWGRLKRALDKAFAYFDACQSDDGRRLAQGLRDAIDSFPSEPTGPQ